MHCFLQQGAAGKRRKRSQLKTLSGGAERAREALRTRRAPLRRYARERAGLLQAIAAEVAPALGLATLAALAVLAVFLHVAFCFYSLAMFAALDSHALPVPR